MTPQKRKREVQVAMMTPSKDPSVKSEYMKVVKKLLAEDCDNPLKKQVLDFLWKAMTKANFVRIQEVLRWMQEAPNYYAEYLNLTGPKDAVEAERTLRTVLSNLVEVVTGTYRHLCELEKFAKQMDALEQAIESNTITDSTRVI